MTKYNDCIKRLHYGAYILCRQGIKEDTFFHNLFQFLYTKQSVWVFVALKLATINLLKRFVAWFSWWLTIKADFDKPRERPNLTYSPRVTNKLVMVWQGKWDP